MPPGGHGVGMWRWVGALSVAHRLPWSFCSASPDVVALTSCCLPSVPKLFTPATPIPVPTVLGKLTPYRASCWRLFFFFFWLLHSSWRQVYQLLKWELDRRLQKPDWYKVLWHPKYVYEAPTFWYEKWVISQGILKKDRNQGKELWFWPTGKE